MPSKAGNFECYVPPGYADHVRRILYVGKATAGIFEGDDPGKLYFNNNNSAFWQFARKVSHLADTNCTDLSNVAWSNIFKQGVAKGNPIGQFAEAQRADAIRELRDEVTRLKPSLIVLVNADYYEEIPKAAYDIIDGEIGPQALTRTPVDGEAKFDLWSRASYGGYPPIMWMWHPERKRTEYTEAALKLIVETTGWKQRIPSHPDIHSC